MAKKKETKKWDLAIRKIIGKALSGTVLYALSILGKNIRRLESMKSRAEYMAKKLKEKTLKIMKANGISEIRITRRTFIRRDTVFSIPKDEEGAEVFGKIATVYGEKFANQLIIGSIDQIPARSETTYKVNNKFLDGLEDAIKENIAEIIGNPQKLTVGETPKRVARGQKRAKRRREQSSDGASR